MIANIPQIRAGIVAVSRDCFPESLSVNRRRAVVEAYEKKYGRESIYECPVCIVESELHMLQALEWQHGIQDAIPATWPGSSILLLVVTLQVSSATQETGCG